MVRTSRRRRGVRRGVNHGSGQPTRTASRLAIGVAILGLVLGLTASEARAEGRPILLVSHFGPPPADAQHHVRALLDAMGDDAPLHDDALRRAIDLRLSRSAGAQRISAADRALLEEGRQQFIEGNYLQAIATLEKVRRCLLDSVAAVAADQSLRDGLHQTLLYLAHAHLRARQPEQATERIGEAIRSFSDRDLSLARHSPELVQFFKRVRHSMQREQRGALQVKTRPPGCMVFVNERFVGVSPTTTSRLHPGEYRVYVQRGNQRGRVHPVVVAASTEEISVDFEFDRRLVTHSLIGLRFDSAAERSRHQQAHAARVGQALHAPLVLLLGFGRHDGRRMLEATVVSTATGRAIRSGRVALEPAEPAPETYAHLGRFLLAGQRGPGVIVPGEPGGRDASAAADSRGNTPGDSGLLSARVFKWVTAALALGAIAGGATLIALDGEGTCDAAAGVACKDVYQTAAAGVGLTVGGGLLAATSGYLFYRDASSRRSASVSSADQRHGASGAARLSTWIGPRGAGLVGTVDF